MMTVCVVVVVLLVIVCLQMWRAAAMRTRLRAALAIAARKGFIVKVYKRTLSENALLAEYEVPALLPDMFADYSVAGQSGASFLDAADRAAMVSKALDRAHAEFGAGLLG